MPECQHGRSLSTILTVASMECPASALYADLHRPIFVYDIGDRSTTGPPVVWCAERRFVHLTRGFTNLERMVRVPGASIAVAPVCPHVWRGNFCLYGIHCSRIHVPMDTCTPLRDYDRIPVNYLSVQRLQHAR